MTSQHHRRQRFKSNNINMHAIAFLSPLTLRTNLSKTQSTLPTRVSPPNRPLIIYAKVSSTNQATQYVPLHVHSDFSLLDGASQLPALVQRAAELQVPALALTDHGVLYGAVQLVRMCKSTSVKPIIGNEMYTVNAPIPLESESSPENRVKRYHLIVLAKNTTGYRNLVKLTSLAHLDGVVGKGIFARPCVNRELLYKHREGLIVSSACLGGEIPQAILNNDIDKAREVATWYRDAFGEDFYLEIQDHGSDEDKKVNPVIIQIGNELGIKVIATNDSHFTSCLDAEAHDALICIQTGKVLTDENRLRYAGNEYFKSVDEMRQCFVDHLDIRDVDIALQNTINVASKVQAYELFGETRIPDFPVPKNLKLSHNDYLRQVSHNSLENRLQARIKSGLVDPTRRKEYTERLQLELNMICQMGFSSYFLVVWDYIRYAKEIGIPVGPGRGSAAGSLVAFALRITDVDPIPYNLLFERFLNPERKSMPDIDTDFSVEGRERIIKYVTERYGTGRVAQIITFNRLTSKAVLKDVARVHQVPYSEADRLAKLIPVVRGKPATLTQLMSKDSPSPEFKQTVERNPSYEQWFDKAKRIEGTNKTYGIHAAGVVISASPLTDIVPLSRAKHGETITQYAMEDVESLGLLKMDFLGLKNLSVIETALEFINSGRRKRGEVGDLEFSVDSLPLDDQKTYKLLAEGELDGIFQLDASAGMRNIVREFRPSSLEDISSILALYRPGPLDAGLIPKFIRRKHGIDSIEYDHPLLKPILRETYGIMVYQEQIMRIARDLAGYSLGQADILRRAMGKKKTKEMEKERPRFLAGAEERGIPKNLATNLFDQMIKFAEYCFNKSHSTAYAYLTYQTAYLKANYPVEYSASLLRSNMNQSDKLVRYLSDANILGVKVLPPNVNKSDLGFAVDTTEENKAVVLFGLEAVKTVGESVGRALIEERQARGPFKSIIDLIERVNLRVLNKRAMGALIRAGAFDKLHHNRKILLEELDSLLALRRRLRDKRKQKSKKSMSNEERQQLDDSEQYEWEKAKAGLTQKSNNEADFPILEKLAGEKATMGFYASGHPLYDLQPMQKVLGCTRVVDIVGNQDDSSESFHDDRAASGTGVMVLSCISDLKKMTTAKGKKMAKWMIEDATSRVVGIVFPNCYDIVEQVCSVLSEAGSLDTASTDSKESAETVATPVQSEESSLVVENDARVIVWGTVDRESSGTSQVIVDDVQRIEHVEAVFATAKYDPELNREAHMMILRDAVRSIMQIDNSKNSYSYIDKNGERQTRWRRRTIPISEKKRIPLILKCVDKEGKVLSYTYAGNNFRFPSESVDFISKLQGVAGCKFTKRYVSDELQDKSVQFVSKVKDTKSERPSEREGKLKNKEVTLVNEKKEYNTDLVSAHHSSPSSIPPSSENESDNEARKIKDRVPRDRPEKAQIDEIGEFSEKNRIAQMTADGPAGFINGIRVEKSWSGAFMDIRASPRCHELPASKEFEDTPKLSKNTATLLRADANRTVLQNLRKVPASSSSLMFINDSQTNSTNEENTSNVQPSITSDTAFTQPQPQAVSPTVPVPKISNTSKWVSLGTTSNKSERLKSTVDWDQESKTLDEQRRKTEPQTGKIRCDSVDKEMSNEEKDFQSYFNQRGLELSGLTINLDNDKFAGLLDGVCLVAHHAAVEYSRMPCKVDSMTGLDIAKLTEEHVFIQLSGKVASVSENYVYVNIDIRETAPSGKRKRVRSFGPAVVILKCDSSLSEMTLKTKKAMKTLESVQQKLLVASDTSFASSIIKPSKAPKSSKKKVMTFTSSDAGIFLTRTWNDDSHELDRLVDGGELISIMARAAEVATENALHAPKKVRVIGMDHMFVEGTFNLMCAKSLSVRVHFASSSFSNLKLQVEACILSSQSEQTSFRATFSLESLNPALLKESRLEVDEDPLYSESHFSTRFKEYLRRIKSQAQ